MSKNLNKQHVEVSSTMQCTMGIKQYQSNSVYTAGAERTFIKNTTTTNVKRTLSRQAFWNKVFDLPLVASNLGTRLKREKRCSISLQNHHEQKYQAFWGADVHTTTEFQQLDERAFRITSCFKLRSGKLRNSSFFSGIELGDWTKDNFICAPGASYNGGRFQKYKTIYPPFLPKALRGKDIPLITSEIPGLALDKQQSQMDLLTSEITSPMLGIWLKKEGKCLWLITEQVNAAGNTGFSVREDLDAKRLSIDIVTPMVREKSSSHGASAMPSWDTARTLKKGDQATLSFTVHEFECQTITDFYRAFAYLTTQNKGIPSLADNSLPFSHAWQLIEHLYNSTKWDSKHGYYHAGFIPPFIPAESWSAGWTGGLALSFALLHGGNQISQTRAIQNLAFFMSDGGQAPTGIFYATSDGESWGGDDYFTHSDIGSNDWIHVRRCGDYLYFVIKYFKLLEARGMGELIKPEWKHKTRCCADALCTVWETNRHFGQYINPNTLEIRIGNSDAGNIIPAALAACGSYFQCDKFNKVAEESLVSYYSNYLEKGFTAGGPLEILCAPDCESAVNLLESLVVVFEVTGAQHWLDKAHCYSNYVRTWFYSYDVVFPKGSLYSRLDIKTSGAMMASSQNRCGVPNICTLSGDVFWKLYRYTKDESLLKLIQVCVHNTQQYLSRRDNPIKTLRGQVLPDGSIHECVQTGDWAGPSGEIPYEYPTSWAEVAHLLSLCELPGIYLAPDSETLCVFDHLEAKIATMTADSITLSVSNPTAYESVTQLYVETEHQMSGPLAVDLKAVLIPLTVPAGKTIKYVVDLNKRCKTAAQCTV